MALELFLIVMLPKKVPLMNYRNINKEGNALGMHKCHSSCPLKEVRDHLYLSASGKIDSTKGEKRKERP